MRRPDVTSAALAANLQRFAGRVAAQTRRLVLVLATCAASGCASNQLQPTIVSSADATGYAVRYPEALSAEAAGFEAHKRQAHELSTGLLARVRELKPSEDRALLSRVVEQADQDGKRESFARAQRSDRMLRAFWDEERAPVSARVAAATQKQISEANCTVADTQPIVQQALRAGFDRQLERRLRTHSEAQRLLEKYKTRLSAATLAVLQRLVDEIALDSYLVNVALVEDVNALNHRVSEVTAVEGTLQQALDDERALQTTPQKPPEQKATQERLQQITASRVALAASRDKAQHQLGDYQAQLQLARDEYARALDAIKTALATPAAAVPATAPAARSAATSVHAAATASGSVTAPSTAPAPGAAPAPAGATPAPAH